MCGLPEEMVMCVMPNVCVCIRCWLTSVAGPRPDGLDPAEKYNVIQRLNWFWNVRLGIHTHTWRKILNSSSLMINTLMRNREP